MIGILVQLIISAALLWFIEKQSLVALGPLPVLVRLRQFIFGFIISALLCTITQLFNSSFTHSIWKLNDLFDYSLLYNSLWLDAKSVLFEELLFRGALLYIAIKKLGSTKGVVLSAVAFGIYHWFSYNAFGNPIAMIYIFMATGLMGYVWAYSFSKTNSMALAIGLHLGWNVLFNSIFSKGSWGDVVFVLQQTEDTIQLTGIISLINFALPILIVPLISFWFVFRMGKQVDSGPN